MFRNFYRLENEHLNNVGQFRAVNIVPIPHIDIIGDEEITQQFLQKSNEQPMTQLLADPAIHRRIQLKRARSLSMLTKADSHTLLPTQPLRDRLKQTVGGVGVGVDSIIIESELEVESPIVRAPPPPFEEIAIDTDGLSQPSPNSMDQIALITDPTNDRAAIQPNSSRDDSRRRSSIASEFAVHETGEADSSSDDADSDASSNGDVRVASESIVDVPPSLDGLMVDSIDGGDADVSRMIRKIARRERRRQRIEAGEIGTTRTATRRTSGNNRQTVRTTNNASTYLQSKQVTLHAIGDQLDQLVDGVDSLAGRSPSAFTLVRSFSSSALARSNGSAPRLAALDTEPQQHDQLQLRVREDDTQMKDRTPTKYKLDDSEATEVAAGTTSRTETQGDEQVEIP